MVRAAKSAGQGKRRARHMVGVNRREQADRAREIIEAMPEADRVLEKVKLKLEDKGISLLDGSIYGHIKAVRLKAVNGANGNGSGSGLEERVQIVGRAIKLCGGVAGVRDTLRLIENIKSM